MTAKFWTLLTGVDTVQPFYDQTEAETAAAAFIQSCDDDRTVTVENWREQLAELNAEMEDAGEAAYVCCLTEHPIPEFRALAVLEDGEVCRFESSSPLLSNLKIGVVETKFSLFDYHPDDIFEIQTPDGRISAVGHTQGVQPPQWPITTIFEDISRKDLGQ